MYEDYEALKIERRGKILVLTIDNPPMNAMSPALQSDLSRIFVDINRDPAVAVVVLTGSGSKAFSAGGDVKAMAERIEQGAHDKWLQGITAGKRILYGLLNLERPLITRINGHAMGLGSTLAVFGDFSFMVEDARIADTHVKVGLSAGDGGSLIWPLLVGFTRARKHLLTGRPMTGKEAAEAGLITGSVATIEALDREVYGLAEELAAGATLAINATKQSINLLLRRLLDGMVETHFGLETQTYLSKDHYEAASAFRDKRTPGFRGE
jgi:enoyl-CoA hydratase